MGLFIVINIKKAKITILSEYSKIYEFTKLLLKEYYFFGGAINGSTSIRANLNTLPVILLYKNKSFLPSTIV